MKYPIKWKDYCIDFTDNQDKLQQVKIAKARWVDVYVFVQDTKWKCDKILSSDIIIPN